MNLVLTFFFALPIFLISTCSVLLELTRDEIKRYERAIAKPFSESTFNYYTGIVRLAYLGVFLEVCVLFGIVYNFKDQADTMGVGDVIILLSAYIVGAIFGSGLFNRCLYKEQ